MKKLESSQLQIDQSLEYIENQQQELSTQLEQYELEMRQVFQQTLHTQQADQEREITLGIAENVNLMLDEMGKEVKLMIAECNEKRGAMTEEDKIVGILGQHLSSLQWVEQMCGGLEEAVREVERKVGRV